MKAHLLKVGLQPVFVVETPDGLREITGKPVEIAGADWRGFTVDSFGEDDLRQVGEEYERAIQAQEVQTPEG